MNNGRRVELDVTYNNAPFAGQVGAEIESLTYVDNAADDSDSIDITLDAQDSKWLHGWLPEEGATLRPRIIGRDWNGPGDTHVMECGLFILDDVAYQDAPTTLQVGGVSKPSDTDFSELERETIWKNTSIKRIGESIAGRYGLGFTYDADDYDIECNEQDGTDSSYYNTLCKNYGLILKVYAKRLWVYDRERYKGKRAVQDFDRTNIIPGSLSYNTTLSGTYTGGYFTYTDADKDLDIVCSVGGGNHTKNVNRRATSVYDASVQLCAEINNANHGRVKLKFSVMGNWGVSAGNNLRLTGYGDGLNGGIQQGMMNGSYVLGPYRKLWVYVPKKRLVMALDYPDRIVQWSLYLYLNPIYDRLFIEDSYACRKDKGSHKAAKRLQYWMCQVQRKPGPGWYCLKLDISKYFYRVNHEKLLAILERRVKDPAMMAFIRGVVNSRAEPFGLPRWRTPQDTPPEEWLYEVGMTILEDSVRQIGALATSVEKLAVSMQSMLKEQEKQGKRLEALEGRDGEKWRKVI